LDAVHAREFAEFERICAARARPGTVLEIGAVPSPHSLLCMRALARAERKIGLSLDGAARFRDFEIVGGNANAMAMFPDASFDTVLANSVLEHDPRFWETLGEIRRVARPGALVVIGVPGYTAPAPWKRAVDPLLWVPLVGSWMRRTSLLAATPTLVVHRYPGDYYRFGEDAMREVLLAGLERIEVTTLMFAPRIIGSGIVV